MKVSILKIKIITHWLLLVAILMYVITGLVIMDYRIVQPLTLGLLTKALSSRIHNNLLIPFLILLALHLYFVIGWKKK